MLSHVVVFLYYCHCLAHAAESAHKITALPGEPGPLNFDQYAGYVTVDTSHNRNLFYWFVESQNKPATDPILLWLNGGPGSSSLFGLLGEHGPFRPNADGKSLSVNPYSWNRRANVLYVESPAGVGFSFSDNTSDYHTDDEKTATDNYAFLNQWFAMYPEYSDSAFYLTGESFAGHYLPFLAKKILDGPNAKLRASVKALIIGNPVTNNDWAGNLDEYAFSTILYGHAMIDEEGYQRQVDACGWGAFLRLSSCATNFSDPSAACQQAAENSLSGIAALISSGQLDPYDLLAPVCLSTHSSPLNPHLPRWWTRHMKQPLEGYKPLVDAPLFEEGQSNDTFQPCISNWMTSYLNIPAVQKALHARPTKWQSCSTEVFGHFATFYESVLPTWHVLLSSPIVSRWKVLIYSGASDSVVPFTSSERWISCLGRAVKKPWSYWKIGGQLAGSVKEYDGITFVTIRGCGHMLPWYCPQKAYEFFEQYVLAG